MTSSATEAAKLRLASAVAVLASVALAPLAPAWAQSAPTSLLPAPSTSAPMSGPVVAPGARVDDGATAGASGDGSVEVQQLQNLDYNAFGTIDEAHGGLPASLWSGTDVATADRLLAMVGPSSSRPLNSLTRRVLLSVATPPSGDRAAKGKGEPLISNRVHALWAMGRADDVAALVKGLPAPAVTPGLRRLRADAALLGNDTATACAEVAPLAAANSSDGYVSELRVYCQFAQGQSSQAGLGVEILREQGQGDPTFVSLAESAANGGPASKDAITDPSPLNLAMARLAKAELAPPGPNASAMVLRSVALAIGPYDQRLAAAERAEALDALDTETLRRIYETAPFTSDELNGAENKASSMAPPRAHALLYQAASRQSVPLARAGLIAQALNSATPSATDGSTYFTVARAFAQLIATLQPSNDIALYAPAMARALIAAGQFDAARTWIGWTRAQATSDKSAGAAAAGFSVIAHLAKLDDGALTAEALEAWRKAAAGLPSEAQDRRTSLGLALLLAMGETVPPAAWLSQLDGTALVSAQVPRPVFALGLDAAAASKRVGEVILYARAAMGDGAGVQLDVASLVRVIADLRAAGFEDEARALAVEVAIANGV